MAEPERLRLVMALPINPPASAPTVVAPTTFAVRLRPFLGFEWLLDVFEDLDFISYKQNVSGTNALSPDYGVRLKLLRGHSPKEFQKTSQPKHEAAQTLSQKLCREDQSSYRGDATQIARMDS